MRTKVNEIEFLNDAGEYLDVSISNEEKYITLDLDTSGKFSMDEKDWKIFTKKVNEIFRNMKKENKK
jgi:hypothetical protein